MVNKNRKKYSYYVVLYKVELFHELTVKLQVVSYLRQIDVNRILDPAGIGQRRRRTVDYALIALRMLYHRSFLLCTSRRAGAVTNPLVMCSSAALCASPVKPTFHHAAPIIRTLLTTSTIALTIRDCTNCGMHVRLTTVQSLNCCFV